MCEIYFRRADDQVERVSLGQGETVLNGLLNRGVEVPYGCLTGVCQSCLLKSSDSEIPDGVFSQLLLSPQASDDC